MNPGVAQVGPCGAGRSGGDSGSGRDAYTSHQPPDAPAPPPASLECGLETLIVEGERFKLTITWGGVRGGASQHRASQRRHSRFRGLMRRLLGSVDI